MVILKNRNTFGGDVFFKLKTIQKRGVSLIPVNSCCSTFFGKVLPSQFQGAGSAAGFMFLEFYV